MDRTESTVRNMLTAIEAPFYDVGVLSDRGMLPGLDRISAAAVLEKLPLLKYRNAQGSHIYIRPSGEHRYTTLDDLSETSLTRLSRDGFNPCAVVETSAGNFQAWLKHHRIFPKLLGTLAAQTLTERYDATPARRGLEEVWTAARDLNCKPKYRKSTASSLSCACTATVDNKYPWRRPSSRITTLRGPRAERGEASQSSLSPRGTEVIEPVS